MDSLLDEKYSKKKRKFSPDTQGSSKSPRTVKKGKTIPRTELREGESRKRKKEHVSSNGSKQRKLLEKKQRKNLKDSKKEISEVTIWESRKLILLKLQNDKKKNLMSSGDNNSLETCTHVSQADGQDSFM